MAGIRILYFIFISVVAGKLLKGSDEEDKKPVHPKLASFSKNAHLRPTKCQGKLHKGLSFLEILRKTMLVVKE